MHKTACLITFFLLFTMGCGYSTVSLHLPDGFEIQARVADTAKKTAKGLMFVKHLPENQGMLFVFTQEETQHFWMKNTLIDLDIIFLNSDGKINQIFEQVPHTYTYTPDAHIPVVSAPAQYVLEVPAGTAARHQLKIGEKISFSL